MRNTIESLCGRLVSVSGLIKKHFRWENSRLFPVCANLFCADGRDPDPERLMACRDLIKSSTGVFSNFRGNVRLPLICLLSMQENPEARLSRVMEDYDLLKRLFFSSEYLVLGAWSLSELDRSKAEACAVRARELYNRMKKEHPLLTGSEDTVLCVLLAMLDRSDDELISDMEETYALLKPRLHSGDSVQTVSHVLAMDPRAPKEKAGRVADLCDAMSLRDIRYNRSSDLAVLASLALADGEIRELADELKEAESCLAGYDGWHGFFGYDRRTRTVHAAMLTADLHLPAKRQEGIYLSSTLTAMIAQQAMLCAVIAASAAASAASSSH